MCFFQFWVPIRFWKPTQLCDRKRNRIVDFHTHPNWLGWLILILTETNDFAHYYFHFHINFNWNIFEIYYKNFVKWQLVLQELPNSLFIPFDSQARRWTVTQQFHEFLSLLFEELTHFSFRLILRRFMRIPTDPFWLFPTDSDWDERVRTLLSSKDDIFISRGHRSLR